MRAQENLKGSAMDEFMERAKDDVKHVKEEIKTFFGKASEFTKKVFKKKQQEPEPPK